MIEHWLKPDISLGSILTAASVLLALWSLHKKNVQRVEEAAARLAEIEAKVNAIWEWWVRRAMRPRGDRDPFNGC